MPRGNVMASQHPAPPRALAPPIPRVVQVLGLACLWLVFSGKFDLLHVLYGALSIALTLLLSGPLLAPASAAEAGLWRRLRWRLVVTFPFWLVREIVTANLQVAKLILRGKSALEPMLLEFRLGTSCPFTLVTLGNSITLTPGTLTVEVEGDRFVIHAITPEAAGSLVDGSMQRRIASMFGVDLDGPFAVTRRDATTVTP